MEARVCGEVGASWRATFERLASGGRGAYPDIRVAGKPGAAMAVVLLVEGNFHVT